MDLGRSESYYPRPTVDAREPDEKVDLAALLAELDEALHAHGARVRPPAKQEAIAAAERQLGCSFPAMLRELYSWHDGGTGVLPGYDWLSLAELVDEFNGLRQLEREVQAPPGDLLPVAYLPIFRFDAQQHVSIDCSGETGALYYSFFQNPGPTPEYRGLGHLLTVTADGYRQDAFKNRGSYFDIDEARLYELRRQRAAPGELDRMEANWRGLGPLLETARGEYFKLAVTWIDHVPDRRAVPILLLRLGDMDPVIVAYAASALGRLRAPEAIGPLTAILSHDHGMVRNFAALALSKMERMPKATVLELIKRLDDADDLAAISAIEALGEAKAPEAVQPMIERLPSVRPGLQQSIVSALGEIGDARALPSLRVLLSTVATQDMSIPDRGGTRSSDPTPLRLRSTVEEAIETIEQGR